MSRGQQSAIYNTGTSENKTYNTDAQQAFSQSQGDIGQYESDLAKFASQNPYVQGGEYATSQNQSLADTANAGANATAQALQSAAVHGGANPAQAIAASEEVAQQNQRTLGQQEAQANQQRIGAEAGYNEKTLAGYQTAQQMQEQLANQQGQLAQGALNTAEQAAKQPSFEDMLGQQMLTSLGDAANNFSKAGAAAAFGGCWIAARLWSGWTDRRTVLVRLWLHIAFARRWYGPPVLKLYAHIGERVAERWMPRSKLLTRVLRAVFYRALEHAETWLTTREGSAAYGAHFQFESRNRKGWPETRLKQFADAALCAAMIAASAFPSNSGAGNARGVVRDAEVR